MLLNAQQILDAGDCRTVEVPVPEWGPGAAVLVGTIGALERARMQDWLDTLGRPIGSPTPQEGEPVTCDDAPEPDEPHENPAALLESAKGLLERFAALCGEHPPDRKDAKRLAACVADAKDLLEGKLAPPDRIYSRTDDIEVSIRWCAAAILDPNTRRPAFTRDQVEALGAKDPAVLNRICAAAMELNLATRQASDDFKKNSPGTPAESSGGA